MFVSGPVGTSVILPSRRADLVGQVVDRVLLLGRARGRRQVGAVEPGLAVHVRRDVALAQERLVGAGVDRDVGAARELEHAQRVGGRLVERLVARDGRHADELELGRGDGQQEGDRVVVTGIAVEDDRRRSHAASIASTSRAPGREGCAPSRDAASAPAAHARASASSRGRPSSSETTRHAANASPAAVPSIGVDARRRRARDLAPVLEQGGALGAVGDRDELAARDDLVLEPVHDQQVGLELDRPRRRGIEREELRAARGRGDDLVRHLELAEDRATRRLSARPRRSRRGRRRSGSRRRRSTRISAIPVVPVRRTSSSTPAACRPASASSASGSSPTAPTMRHLCSELRRRDRLVRALAAGKALEVASRRPSPPPAAAARPVRRGRG